MVDQTQTAVVVVVGQMNPGQTLLRLLWLCVESGEKKRRIGGLGIVGQMLMVV